MTATQPAANATISEKAITALRTRLRGTLIRPGEPDYDQARAVWNGMINRRPALIVRCAGNGDVIAAVEFAREQDLPLAVRGGGHNAAGLAVCDGGVVVDLSTMRAVRVDPQARTLRAEGGAIWADVDRAAQAYGLATTGGAISSTGVAGLSLGGGLGWLMRSHGLACDNLLSADVATADGRIVTASEREHADLFWGLRGGGGNFGAVTAFEFRLHPVGPVLAGMLVHPLARAGEVLRFYREFTRSAPDALTVFVTLMTLPDGVPVIALMLCYNGPITEGERLVAPLRAFGPPILDQVAPMPYVQLQRLLDEAFPAGLQVYWRSHFLSGLEDTAIDTLLMHTAAATSPLTVVLVEQLGGAVSRVERGATAFDQRSARFNLAIVTRWLGGEEAAPHTAWTRGLWAAMQPYAAGVYVNYLGVEEGEGRVREAYGEQSYARLAALKAAYDPSNRFRANQNIPPAS